MESVRGNVDDEFIFDLHAFDGKLVDPFKDVSQDKHVVCFFN